MEGKHITMTNGERIITIPRANPVDAFTMAGIVNHWLHFITAIMGNLRDYLWIHRELLEKYCFFLDIIF